MTGRNWGYILLHWSDFNKKEKAIYTLLDWEEDIRVTWELVKPSLLGFFHNPHLSIDREKASVNGDDYLPEVCHGGKKWALWGDVSRVARVMVHLGEREQSVTQCLGRRKTHTVWVKDFHESLHLEHHTSAVFSLSSIHWFSLSERRHPRFFPPRHFPRVFKIWRLTKGLIILNWNVERTLFWLNIIVPRWISFKHMEDTVVVFVI